MPSSSSSPPSSTFGRIGKSLLKYFKPIRVAPPHYQPRDPWSSSKGSSQDPNRKAFKLLRFKKPGELSKDELNKAAERAQAIAADATEPALPEKTPTQWVELVIYLLAACRKATAAMKKKIGVATYQKTMQSRGQQKIRTLGSIVNTTSTDLDSSAKPKKVA